MIKSRFFESSRNILKDKNKTLLLRQKSTVILIELQWTFSIPENRLK